MRRTIALLLVATLAGGPTWGCFESSQTGLTVTEADAAADAEPGDADDERDAEIAALLEEAKFWLASGEPHMAYDLYGRVLDEYDPDLLEARFGSAISGIEDTVELVMMLVGVITGALNMFGVDDAPGGLSENEYVAWLLSDTLGRIGGRLGEAAAHLDAAAADPGFVFHIEPGAPIYLNAKPALLLGPELDAADAGFMAYGARVLRGLIDLLAAQDLSSDVMGIVARVESGAIGDLDGASLASVIAYLMNADERFLTLAPDGGDETLEQMRLEWARAQDDFLGGLANLRAETDDQADDTVVLERRGTGRRARDVVVLRGVWDEDVSDFSGEVSVALDLRAEAAAAAIRDNLMGDGVPLNWGEQVLPVLASMLLAVIEAGVLEALGLELPQDLLDSFGGMTPEEFGDFISTLVPDALELDLGTSLGGGALPPVGLRAIFPGWTTDRPRWENHLVTEYECPDDLNAEGFPSGTLGLFCHEDAELTDAPHFVGTPHEMAEDKVKGKLPYLRFQDPTINGMLYLDMTKAKIAGYGAAEGYVEPDNRDLNAFLQRTMRSILFLIGK